jgi:hypothetical protein
VEKLARVYRRRRRRRRRNFMNRKCKTDESDTRADRK